MESALNILLVAQSDTSGGAARAANRLHRALLEQGEFSRMKVRSKKSDDWTVERAGGKVGTATEWLRPQAGRLLGWQHTPNAALHSGNFLPSRWAPEIDRSPADVVNLHWVGGETLSIRDIGRIRKPLVWTLHDMWAFCGAEHYAPDDPSARWRTGYHAGNREPGASGPDWNRQVWRRKRKCWRKPMQIVVPSRWMAECVRQSALLRNWPVAVIPYTLDIKRFQPLPRAFCRNVLDLPPDRKLLLFGAAGGIKDAIKGWDLLESALYQLFQAQPAAAITCVVFGQSEPRTPPALPFAVRWMGTVQDDATLALLYNAADVMVVPSRQDNLPQTATEAQACGCPVVAFDCTGLRDAVEHVRTGFLAPPYETAGLAEGLRWVLEDEARRQELGAAARRRAMALWRAEAIVPQYIAVYEKAIANSAAKAV
jgi:glycosyltransferase involved in cell wall biosynthesis